MSTVFTFWASAALMGYVYAGYPALLWLFTRLSRHPQEKKSIEPRVTLLVAAYNEGAVIEAKVRNALALDYPAERLEIVIASDGSSDGTAEIVHRSAQNEG